MDCYCTCILEILRYFFILQSSTTSKMRKFQTLKLSQFHKAKTCWTENWWSSGIMSNFWGEFFYVLGAKFFSHNFFKSIVLSGLKWTLKKILMLGKKLWFLNWNYHHKIFIMMWSIPYTRVMPIYNSPFTKCMIFIGWLFLWLTAFSQIVSALE